MSADDLKRYGYAPERRTKTCAWCGKVKLLDDFPADKQRHDGRSSFCKACSSKMTAKQKPAHRSRDDRDRGLIL